MTSLFLDRCGAKPGRYFVRRLSFRRAGIFRIRKHYFEGECARHNRPSPCGALVWAQGDVVTGAPPPLSCIPPVVMQNRPTGLNWTENADNADECLLAAAFLLLGFEVGVGLGRLLFGMVNLAGWLGANLPQFALVDAVRHDGLSGVFARLELRPLRNCMGARAGGALSTHLQSYAMRNSEN